MTRLHQLHAFTADFPLSFDRDGRVRTLVPMPVRERFLHESVPGEKAEFQTIGQHLRGTIWSDRYVVMVYFPLDASWRTGPPWQRTISQSWHVYLSRWADDLCYDGSEIEAEVEVYREGE